MIKKMFAILCALGLASGLLTACSGAADEGETGSEAADAVYFLNFDADNGDLYEEIAKTYTHETGKAVKVVTAASDKYEETLQAEIEKPDAPTIFRLSGPDGFKSWKDYCMDIRETDLYENLIDKRLAIRADDGVFAVPFAIEGYGILYNKAILDAYFQLKDKAVKIDDAEQITSFKTLKAVVEDMQKHKDTLKIKGVFSSAGLKAGEDLRWHTQLAGVPLFYEFGGDKADGDVLSAGMEAEEITFQYADRFKNLLDLYLDNAVSDKSMLGDMMPSDATREFALGESAMMQTGNWAWSEISMVEGNKVEEENLKFLPLYIGADEEEKQGLCVGTKDYIAINAKASDDKKKDALDFLSWLYTSETGKKYLSNDLAVISPYDNLSEAEQPEDPLAKELLRWMHKDDVQPVVCAISDFPGGNFAETFGAALLDYVKGNKVWEDVRSTVVDTWKTARAAIGG